MSARHDTNLPVVRLKPGPKSRLEEDFAHSLDQLRALGRIQCTVAEAAAVLCVSRTALINFMSRNPEAAEAFDYGAEEGKASLRRTQWLMAQRNPAMAIWLGKQWLGQRDKADLKVTEVSHEEALRALG